MLAMLARNWWLVTIRGVSAVIFGILTLFWPLLTLHTLLLLFGAYALVNGFLAIVQGVMSLGKERWLLSIILGVVSIFAGLFVIFQPGATALILLYTIAAWALITGVTEIVTAIQLRRVIDNEWVMMLSGVASIIFAIILILFPGSGALSLTWLIGFFAIMYGVLLIVFSLRLRKIHQMQQPPSSS